MDRTYAELVDCQKQLESRNAELTNLRHFMSSIMVSIIERNELGATPIATHPILTTQSGGWMSYRYMAQIMLKERKRLGLEAYDLHALRYRGVMELAWAGCDDDEIASYSGHATKEMVAKYAGEARQIMRARQASEKRL